MPPRPKRLFLRSVSEPFSFLSNEIQHLYPNRFNPAGIAVDVIFDSTLGAGAHRLTCHKKEAQLVAGDRMGAARGLAHLMGAARECSVKSYQEPATFARTLGTMLDCSRNAVPTVETLKNLLLKTALMGYNSAMLYMEDTYVVEEEPFFGYLRGGYTKAQLKELDDYADAIGVELFPAIQTLGHMEQFLQWPAAHKYQDTCTVLCALQEETYTFLRHCLATLSECFRSRRINLGMDEAFGLGEGAFKRKVGSMPPAEIMNRHLERVKALCAEFDYKPMIWSDMYFRCGSKTFDYYDPDWHLDPETIAKIPSDVQLCYWDYYHLETSHYERFLRFHQTLPCDIIFCGTGWVSNRLWCSLSYAEKTLNAALPACRTCNVQEIFISLWSDDGAECDLSTALPALQHAAELVYSPDGQYTEDLRATHLLGSCNLIYSDWQIADLVNTNEFYPDLPEAPSGAEKNLFWEDPALAIFQAQCPNDRPVQEAYATYWAKLVPASARTPESSYLYFQAMVSIAIHYKLGLREAIHNAILQGDHLEVKILVDTRMTRLRQCVESALIERRIHWMNHNSPMGWEVQEARYAAMIERLKTLADRLLAWARGDIDSVPEYEVELRPLTEPGATPMHLQKLPYTRMKTPSWIN